MRDRIDIDRLKREHSPVSFIPEDCRPRKSGSNWRSRCPLHGGDGLSLSVFPGNDGWRYNCFACGSSGDVIAFVMQLEGLDFKRAVERINGAPSDGVIPACAKKPDKGFVIPCYTVGCGDRLAVDLEEIPYLGRNLHNAWSFKRLRGEISDARCSACVRTEKFGAPDGTVARSQNTGASVTAIAAVKQIVGDRTRQRGNESSLESAPSSSQRAWSHYLHVGAR